MSLGDKFVGIRCMVLGDYRSEAPYPYTVVLANLSPEGRLLWHLMTDGGVTKTASFVDCRVDPEQAKALNGFKAA